MVSSVNNVKFWHLCSSLRTRTSFFLSFMLDTRSAVFPLSRATEPGRGGYTDSLSLLMEKVHNVSSVHQLTLEASQWRTKPSQSGGPTWVFGLSSGFIMLHRGYIGAVSHNKVWRYDPSPTSSQGNPLPEFRYEDQGAGGCQYGRDRSNRWIP